MVDVRRDNDNQDYDDKFDSAYFINFCNQIVNIINCFELLFIVLLFKLFLCDSDVYGMCDYCQLSIQNINIWSKNWKLK